MAPDIPPFVQSTPLYNGFFAKDLGHAGGEGLGPVDHDQQVSVGLQSSGDQVGEKGGDQGLVLGVAQPQPTGTLVPSVVMTKAATQH